MKCARCGYFNLPGAQVCGRCGANPADDAPTEEAAPALAAWDDVLPPRARQRTAATRVRQQARREANRALRVAAGTSGRPGRLPHTQDIAGQVRQDGAQAWGDARPWLLSTLSVVPGLGQCVQRRGRGGTMFTGASLILLLLAAAFFRTGLSDVLLWGLLGLSLWSVFDTAQNAFPPTANTPNAAGLRQTRLAFLSVALVVGTLACVFALLGLRWTPFMTRTDLAAPVLREGDGLVMESLSRPNTQVRRGDILLSRGIMEGNHSDSVIVAERALGQPGDRVEARGGALFVNGRLLPPNRLPLALHPPVPDFSVTVPPQTFCVWNTTVWAGEENRAGGPFLLLPSSDVSGRVVARYAPPARRRLFP